MARINVTEKDLSWYTRQGSGPIVVYVPGVSTNGPTDRPEICDSLPMFERIFGTALSVDGLSRSYDIAASFIKAGASVLFHRFVGADAVAPKVILDKSGYLELQAKHPGEFLNNCSVTVAKGLSTWAFTVKTPDGHVLERFNANFKDPSSEKYYSADISDYFNVIVGDDAPKDLSSIEIVTEAAVLTGGTSNMSTDEDVIKALTAEGALDILLDPYIFDFDVAISAGFNKTMDLANIDIVDKALVDAVKGRGTSLYLVDGIAGSTPEEFYSYCSQFDTSYAAGIGPWGYAKYLNTGATALLPGSYAHLVQWIKSAAEGVPIWMAPAGVKRASLGSFYVKPQYEIGKSILDAWQVNDEDPAIDCYKVNPIMRAKSYGYIIYGNSTLLHSSEEGKTSMLQSISTRVMANVIKKEAFNIALGLQFDQMVGDVYAQFKTLMGAKLDEMKYQGAIYDYRVIVDSSLITVGNLNERKVPVKIQISPAPAVENFDITLEITKAGLTFTDDGSTATAVVISDEE